MTTSSEMLLKQQIPMLSAVYIYLYLYANKNVTTTSFIEIRKEIVTHMHRNTKHCNTNASPIKS